MGLLSGSSQDILREGGLSELSVFNIALPLLSVEWCSNPTPLRVVKPDSGVLSPDVGADIMIRDGNIMLGIDQHAQI
jgi:hypothetical protein